MDECQPLQLGGYDLGGVDVVAEYGRSLNSFTLELNLSNSRTHL